MIAQATHPLYVLRWLLGDVAHVSASAGASTLDMTGEDTAALTVGFRSDALASLIATFAAGLARAQEAPRPITLDEAVQLAQRNAPLAVQARGQLRSSDATVRGAYAAFLPDVSLSMSRAWEGGTRTVQAGRPVGDVPHRQ